MQIQLNSWTSLAISCIELHCSFNKTKVQNFSCSGLKSLVNIKENIAMLKMLFESKTAYQWVLVWSRHHKNHASKRVVFIDCFDVRGTHEHRSILVLTDVNDYSGIGTFLGYTVITSLDSQLKKREPFIWFNLLNCIAYISFFLLQI